MNTAYVTFHPPADVFYNLLPLKILQDQTHLPLNPRTFSSPENTEWTLNSWVTFSSPFPRCYFHSGKCTYRISVTKKEERFKFISMHTSQWWWYFSSLRVHLCLPARWQKICCQNNVWSMWQAFPYGVILEQILFPNTSCTVENNMKDVICIVYLLAMCGYVMKQQCFSQCT